MPFPILLQPLLQEGTQFVKSIFCLEASEKSGKLEIGKKVFKPDLFNGWGIRTLSSEELRYNPMSYHNGSVWPHDIALIGEGLARYGYQQQALQLMTGLFDASLFIGLQRLPELFCGMERRRGIHRC